MRVSYKLVFHQSKCISATKSILSTTTTYTSSSSFRYLSIPCYCDACSKSSILRVRVKALHNTIQLIPNCYKEGFICVACVRCHTHALGTHWSHSFMRVKFTRQLSRLINYANVTSPGLLALLGISACVLPPSLKHFASPSGGNSRLGWLRFTSKSLITDKSKMYCHRISWISRMM